MRHARRSTWSRGAPAWDRRERVAVRRLGLLTILLGLILAPFGRPMMADAGAPPSANQTGIVLLKPLAPGATTPARGPCVGTCLLPIPAAANTTAITANAVPATSNIGGTLRDIAHLTGGVTPTGTVTFRLFGPNDATCATAPVFTVSNGLVDEGGGSFRSTSDTFTVTAAGTYQWLATYGGDANNLPATTACTDPAQAVTVNKANTVVSTLAVPQSAAVGVPLTDTAIVSNGTQPTGSVLFELFSDDACTAKVFMGTGAVAAVTGSATSPPFTTTTAGTYHWVATYTGDQNNNPSPPSPCNDLNQRVVVTGLPTSTSSTSSSTTSTTSSSIPSSSTTSSTTPSSSTSSTSPTSSTSSTSTSTTSSSVPTGTSSTTPGSSTTSTSTPGSSTTTTTNPPGSSTSTSTSTTPPSSSTTSSSTSTTAPPVGTSSSSSSTTSSSSSSSSTTSSSTTTSTTSTTIATSTSTTATPGTTTTVTTALSSTTPAAVTTSPQTLAPGDRTTVNGTGFPAGKPVLVQLFSDPVYLGTVNASSRGTFRLVVTIPRATPPGAHTIVATGPGGLARATAPLTVTAPRTALFPQTRMRPIAAQAVPVNTLARTGTPTDRLARLAFILVLTGAVLVGAAWRSPSVSGRRRSS